MWAAATGRVGLGPPACGPWPTGFCSLMESGGPRPTLRSAPIDRVVAATDETLERRKSPISGTLRPVMLDRVVVDVVEMALIVSLVANCVLPEASLPDSAFALRHARITHNFATRDVPRENALDMRPANSVVRVTRRQGPDAVQMIWKHDDRIHIKRPCLFRGAQCSAQHVDPIRKQRRSSISEHYSEEKASARNDCTAIVRHASSSA